MQVNQYNGSLDTPDNLAKDSVIPVLSQFANHVQRFHSVAFVKKLRTTCDKFGVHLPDIDLFSAELLSTLQTNRMDKAVFTRLIAGTTLFDAVGADAAFRSALLSFVPHYTTNAALAHSIAEDLDFSLVQFEKELFAAFPVFEHATNSTNKILQQEAVLFVEKITALSPSMIGICNILTGEYLYINQAVRTLLGYTREEVTEQGVQFFMDILHPADLPRFLEETGRAVEELNACSGNDSDATREVRYRVRHKNGKYKWVQTFSAVFEKDKNERVTKIINISTDISEKLPNEQLVEEKVEEIARQDDRYFKMVEEVEEYAIFMLNRNGIIQNWNRGAQKIKGYDASEIVGKHIRVFYPPEDQNKKLPETLLDEAARKGKSSHEGWRVKKDGSRFWASVVMTAIHDREGKVIGFSKVTKDQTTKKSNEDMLKSYTEQLEQKNMELDSKNKELESFSYVASHDMQEPLRKIKLWANRLQEMGSLPDKADRALSKINTSTTKMQELITGLLGYAHIDSSKVERERVNLNAIVEEVLEDYSEELENKHASIQLGELPVLPMQKTQAKQLFANIISNAIKYSRLDVALKIKIISIHSANHYEIILSDNGSGFRQEYAEKIFGMFQRLEKTAVSGTGIGLAICRKIVESHNGTIRAESEPGVGTTFFISLPA